MPYVIIMWYTSKSTKRPHFKSMSNIKYLVSPQVTKKHNELVLCPANKDYIIHATYMTKMLVKAQTPGLSKNNIIKSPLGAFSTRGDMSLTRNKKSMCATSARCNKGMLNIESLSL